MNASPTIYEQIGKGQIRLLTKNFYWEVAKNEVLIKLYPDDLSFAEARLFLFFLHLLGEPERYTEELGRPRLRMWHARWETTIDMRDQCMRAKSVALEKLRLETTVHGSILSYFKKAANHMINHA